jgi:hypothetical protein
MDCIFGKMYHQMVGDYPGRSHLRVWGSAKAAIAIAMLAISLGF